MEQYCWWSAYALLSNYMIDWEGAECDRESYTTAVKKERIIILSHTQVSCSHSLTSVMSEVLHCFSMLAFLLFLLLCILFLPSSLNPSIIYWCAWRYCHVQRICKYTSELVNIYVLYSKNVYTSKYTKCICQMCNNTAAILIEHKMQHSMSP